MPRPDLVALLSDLTGGKTGPWTEMQGGQSNRLWRVDLPSGAVVVKLFPKRNENPLFPNSAQDEARMLDWLMGRDLAPKLLGVGDCACGPVLVYDHLGGTPWRQDPEPVAKMLRHLHDGPVPDGLRRLPSGSDAVMDQTGRILDLLPNGQRNALQALRPKRTVPATVTPVLLHGDPVPGNVLVAGEKIWLIDWQCPALGDPVEDLALFLMPSMQWVYRRCTLTPLESRAFLGAYGSADLTERTRAMLPWYHWRMAAYCAWKVETGSPAYEQALQLELQALQN